MSSANPDNRRVALIKSVATNNRFYALVSPESGIHNADTVEHIPDELHLGIAYPCLEDGLNDFAVIRTTYETLDYFPGDDPMRTELYQIIDEARGKLIRRLTELQERIAHQRAHFLGTDLNEFKGYIMDIVNRGYPRRNLDSMMKVNVFASVAEAEGNDSVSDPLYTYRFLDDEKKSILGDLPARVFVAEVFGDVLQSVLDDANYVGKYEFDRNVFQKFIAVMFVNYATTDPIFYGTNRADYGVSDDKEMDSTPLYKAVAKELREIEALLGGGELYPIAIVDSAALAKSIDDANVELSNELINEDTLMSPISSICAAAEQLTKSQDGELANFGKVILGDASRLVQELKQLGIVSPFAYNPGSRSYD